MHLNFREANISDIPGMMKVRMSVKENVLNNPDLVTEKDCEDYLTVYGKGWVCEMNNSIVGFSIVGLKQNNIWALFVDPEFERKGIGKKLHDLMMDWYFSRTKETVWLGTSPNTRAETFYQKAGWVKVGVVNKGETKFEMTWERFRKEKASGFRF
jgi:GNAT superfamily N-acetyltransferase